MEKRHYPLAAFLAAFVAVSTIYLNSFVEVSARPSAPAAVPALSAQRYQQDVTYLARPEMKGRGNGSPELQQAGDYIASQFQASGLQPHGENGTYFQTFEITIGVEFGPKNELQINGTGLRLNDEFVPIAFSNTATSAGGVVFAGYGITAPELHYDDYAGIDVKNKVVVVLRHEPQ